ncbi:MAG: hypothetical protein JKY56_00355 [Kofleriaceae bacterium]|nr:hypothetical protein [Kofleriaceae bacterium]
MIINLDSLAQLALTVEPVVDVDKARQALSDLSVVKWLLSEQGFSLNSRAVDMRWEYAGLFPEAINVGFAPFGNAILGPRISASSTWRKSPHRRDFAVLNLDNRLLREVLFQVHDLFHMWAYRRMMHTSKGFAFGMVPIDEKTLSDYVFCHLVSEAAATVGLDYWYLAQRSLGDFFGLHLDFKGLTVSYTQEMDDALTSEAQLTVHSPEFFSAICQLYTTGSLPGTNAKALERVPSLTNWLFHELQYSEVQRVYSYEWFSYLGGLPTPSKAQCLVPIKADTPWRKAVVRDVGSALWKMTQEQRYQIEPHVQHQAYAAQSLPHNPAYSNTCYFSLDNAIPSEMELYRRHKAATYDYSSFTLAQRREISTTDNLDDFHRILKSGTLLRQENEPPLIFQLS